MTVAPARVLRFDRAILPNGLLVIGEHNALAQSTAAGFFVRTGARDETSEIAGVSHFLEHMMFKGTDRRTAEDINRGFDELGAQYNAFTSEERTVYYGAVLPERATELLDLLGDMMRPALRQDDFDVEKKVILEEIAMYEDRPDFRVFERSGERFWNGHPLGRSVLGSTTSVGALTREQMLAYFERRYSPGNLLLVLTGTYDWDAVVDQVTRLSLDWKPFDTGRDYPTPTPREGDEAAEDGKLSRAHIAIHAPGVGAQDPRRYAAALLASVLGDGSGSRLFWTLIDKGLADSASLAHSAADRAGSFDGYLSTDPERMDEVLELYKKVLDDAQDAPIAADEWHRAQRKFATGLTLRTETPLGRLVSLGVGYEVRGDYESADAIVRQVLATTPEQGLALLAERPFDALYTFTLKP